MVKRYLQLMASAAARVRPGIGLYRAGRKAAGMKFQIPVGVAAALLSHWMAVSAQSAKADPFDFLRPTIEFSADDRRELDDRGIVLKILPASGHELATMVAASLNIGPEAFIAKVRNIAALKKGPSVPEIGKFSSSPAIGDLQ